MENPWTLFTARSWLASATSRGRQRLMPRDNSPRLPVRLRHVPNGSYIVEFGGDARARMYVYFVADHNQDVDPRSLREADARALAQDVARTLTDAWSARGTGKPGA